MAIFCSYKEHFLSPLICIYSCRRQKKCKDYLANLDLILGFTIPETYIQKYGEPSIWSPRALRKRTVIKLEDKPQPKPKPQRKKTVKEPEAKPKVTSGKTKAETKAKPDTKPKVATKKTTKKAKPSSSPKPSVTEGKRRVRGKVEPEKKRRKR